VLGFQSKVRSQSYAQPIYIRLLQENVHILHSIVKYAQNYYKTDKESKRYTGKQFFLNKNMEEYEISTLGTVHRDMEGLRPSYSQLLKMQAQKEISIFLKRREIIIQRS
jgi:hypothetical protein